MERAWRRPPLHHCCCHHDSCCPFLPPPLNRHFCDWEYYNNWGVFHQYVFFIFNPKLEEDDPILTFIFFISGLVNQPPTRSYTSQPFTVTTTESWIGFQAPATLEAEDVRDEKVVPVGTQNFSADVSKYCILRLGHNSEIVWNGFTLEV